MRDQAAVLEDRKDLHREGGEVICITFVVNDSIFEVNRYDVTLLHRVDPVFKFDHGKAVVDRIM